MYVWPNKKMQLFYMKKFNKIVADWNSMVFRGNILIQIFYRYKLFHS